MNRVKLEVGANALIRFVAQKFVCLPCPFFECIIWIAKHSESILTHECNVGV